ARLRRLIRRGRALELVDGDGVVARVEPLEDGAVRVESRGDVRIVSADEVDALATLRGEALVAAVRP
ncbi:MAG: hypothetical protein ABMA64_17775, partial [Myxococcota bacterium]